MTSPQETDTELVADFISSVFDATCGYAQIDCEIEEGKFKLSANASDLFYWATSDSVPIETKEDVRLLSDCRRKCPKKFAWLYACKKRGMRPQHPVYKYLDDAEKELFNACGPERGIHDCG